MKSLDNKAREVLLKNDRGKYTIPTDGLYPYQWNWDSAFAAWGFSTFDIPRAWLELETLLAAQWEDGMVPHIIFHKSDPGYFPNADVWETDKTPPTSGITQPPVAATIARLIWEADKEAGIPYLEKLFPGLVRWHRWWHDFRCAGSPATITHPWESGRDNCPDWDSGMAGVDGSGVGDYQRRDTGHVDPSMRPGKEDYDRYIAMVQFGARCGWNQATIVSEGPFLMADPGITFILLRAHHDLAVIAAALGEDSVEIDHWAKSLRNSLPEIWNPDLKAYDAKNMRTGEFAGVLGSGAFLAYLADAGNPELDGQLMRVWDAVKYGVPSADPQAEIFDPRRYWRGPTWPVINSLIALGLKDSGRHDLERRLRSETAALIEKHGFFEYFDPLDATPCGGNHFTWTAAVWLTWAGRDLEVAKGAA